jgi:pyruvate formate lyase activating enzyme
MVFRGWLRTSLIEYPGRVSTVLFCGGCNFRCPFCYNRDLVLHPDRLPAVESDRVLDYLRQHRHLYQAAVVTGGEPLAGEGLAEFLAAVRRLGLRAGLETNGSFSDRLEELLEGERVDFVGMDVKAPLLEDAYSRAAGIPAGPWLAEVERSVALLLASRVEVEFRTTVVGGLHSREDILAIGRRLRGARRYVLQRFNPAGALARGWGKRQVPLRSWLQALRPEVEQFVQVCELRNV